ncbi:hypothetical protein FOYG_01029 [Fusarium oxysporum NRRL 32931]|uniref:Uncharacterized protein n=1 Tax=Fusarium oxysporum NRRL 32931 TaxID=660029 RepID=W9J6W7_FUSOX|nr:hypothetical protein FOYG_01029 [Fusarium oxysporum NRRL 32931]
MEDISPWEDLRFDHLEASGCLCLPLRKDRNRTKRLPNSKHTLCKYKGLSTPLHSPLGQCITAAMSSDSWMLTFGRGNLALASSITYDVLGTNSPPNPAPIYIQAEICCFR